MAGVVGKYAAKKLLAGQLEKHKNKDPVGQYDPYYMIIENPKKPGKFKKVKKQIPDYLPHKDAVILAKARRRAYRLDCSLFNLFGIRFGWGSVIGIIPAVGDVIDALLALMLIRTCMGVEGGLNSTTKLHMLANLIFDFALGLVPFVGDVADAAYKCNSKNVRLLEEHLDRKYKPEAVRKRHKEQARMSGLVEYPPATEFEDFTDEEEERRAVMAGGDGRRQQHNTTAGRSSEPRRPEQARLAKSSREEPQRKKTSRSWFSRAERRRPEDVEMGTAGRNSRPKPGELEVGVTGSSAGR